MRRRFVIGDVHGNLKGLLQVLIESGYDKRKDTLYFLGDVVDGWGDDFECIDVLIAQGAICILGNHDQMFMENLKKGRPDKLQERTLESFEYAIGHLEWFSDLPERIQKFFESAYMYIVLDGPSKKDRIFLMHAGFNRHYMLDKQPIPPRGSIFNWDRDLWLSAVGYEQLDTDYPFKSAELYNRIYIGHTPTLYLNGSDEFLHMQSARVINVDTGGGFAEGRICMLNIDNHEEVYYSDYGHELYNIKAMKTFK